MSEINTIVKEADFNRIPKMLFEAKKPQLFTSVVACIAKSNPSDIVRSTYNVDGHDWVVYHGPTFKMTIDVSDYHYHCFFNKLNGFNLRFGKTIDDDVPVCELGPEILDLEVAVGNCTKVGGVNCRFCYKNNTDRPGRNMSFDMFEKLISRFPHNLSQIAFGITSLHANPDFPKIVEHTRSLGIIPNVTMTGADLDDEMCDMVTKFMGRVAVSCYATDKNLCYRTIAKLHDYAKDKYSREFPCNMHLLVSKDTFNFCKEVLNDIKDGKVPHLKSVVFLRIKPRGRAASLDCTVTEDMYKTLIDFCLENNISFGFDSCSAKAIEKILIKMGKPELCQSVESCESSKLSSYINVDGEYWSCSFCEGNKDVMEGINVFSYLRFTDLWNSEAVKNVRFPKKMACDSCPWYSLD